MSSANVHFQTLLVVLKPFLKTKIYQLSQINIKNIHKYQAYIFEELYSPFNIALAPKKRKKEEEAYMAGITDHSIRFINPKLEEKYKKERTETIKKKHSLVVRVLYLPPSAPHPTLIFLFGIVGCTVLMVFTYVSVDSCCEVHYAHCS